MRKKVWVNIIKSIVFIVILGVILIKVLSILNYKDMGGGGGWQRFYEMPSQTADVIFFGNSHAHCTIDHGILWDEYGIAGYTMSAGSQRLDSTYYFVKEALEVQKPKLLVVEVSAAALSAAENSDESVYRNSLGMKWSSNFLEFVNYLIDDMEEDRTYKNRVLTKFPVIHSRYKELERNDFEDDTPYMKGYRGSFERVEFEQPVEIAEENKLPLDEKYEKFLYKMIESVKGTETELLFWVSPYVVSEEEQMRLNTVAEIAKNENVKMINYNQLYDELEMDFKTDFRDEVHVNNDGAAKVSLHMGEYIKSNYDIPNRKGQAGYEDWELNKRYLDGKSIAKKLKDAAEVNSYLKELGEIEDRTVVLSLTGNHTAAGDVYYDSLSILGISYEDYMKGGVWVFEGGIPVLYLSGKEYKQCYQIVDGEFHFESEIIGEEQEADIIFEGKNYSFVKNGINVLVYDQLTKQMIDHAGINIYVGFDVVRLEEEVN